MDTSTRRADVVVVAVLLALGAYLMLEGILGAEPGVRRDSSSWLMLPVFLGAIVPLLWWRRDPLLAVAAVTAVMSAHVVLFGWGVRCGAGLPLTFVVAYWVGSRDRIGRSLVGLAVSGLLGFVVLVRDSAAGLEVYPAIAVIALLVWGVGRLVGRRRVLSEELRLRTAELADLRDRRAELEVGEDRARMSAELDGLLRERLDQLSQAAWSGPHRGERQDAKALMAGIEAESRRTLTEMREIVGVLRGGEPALAPVPSVAHLDALLATRGSTARLSVSGDPRPLSPSVELSAYRIIEHLLGVLGEDAAAPVEVQVGFEADALELRVSGPVPRGADLRGAVARARERARLQDGTLAVKVTRGRARAVALVPLHAG